MKIAHRISLWVDKPNAQEIAKKKRTCGEISSQEYDELCAFILDGYVVLKNAVPHHIIDNICEDVERIQQNPRHFIVKK